MKVLNLDTTVSDLKLFEKFLRRFNVEKLKFRPIIDQTDTLTYNSSKVIEKYLKSLCQNEKSIKDTQNVPEMLRDLLSLNNDEERVSNDVDNLFTNILLK